MSFGFGQSFASPRAPRRSRGFVPKPAGSTILGLGDSISDATNSLLVGQFLGAHIPLLATMFGWTQVGAGSSAGATGAGFTNAVPGTPTLTIVSIAITGAGAYTVAPTGITASGGGVTVQPSGVAIQTSGVSPNIAVTGVTFTGGGTFTGVPTLAFTGGTGTAATATATMGVGAVPTSVAGTGYTNAAPTLTGTGGGGTGFQAFATLSGTTVGSWNVSAKGSGYTAAPTMVITYPNDPTRGGISGGVLSDYTSIPAVTGAQLLKGTNLANRMTNYAADVIVIGFGTNDWIASYTVGNQTIANPTTFHTDLLSVVTTAQAQANHPLVVLLGTEQWQQITGTLGLTGTPAYASSPSDAVRGWNDAIRQVAFERACPYVDLTGYNYAASVHAVAANNVHPNAAGYLWMRDRIAAAIYGD